MSISNLQAREMALEHLKKFGADEIPVSIFDAHTHEYAEGWVFFYQATRFLETGELGDRLAGNAPVFVAKSGDWVDFISYLRPYDESMAAYRYCENPNGIAMAQVMLSDWRVGALKVKATKAIRAFSGWGLKESKNAVDRCLKREQTLITVADTQTAQELAAELTRIGFVAEVVYIAGAIS